MTPKQHFRALQIRLEIAEFGMALPRDEELVRSLRAQLEQAKKDVAVARTSCSELELLTSDRAE